MSDTPPDPAAADPVATLTAAVARLAELQQDVLAGLRQKPADAPAPITPPAELVRRIVQEMLGEHDETLRKRDVRGRFVAERLVDLPDAYRRLLPETDDARALADAEQQIRRQFREDFKINGGAAPTTETKPGVSPAAAVDYSILSPLQQIALGLKDATPAPRPSRRPANRSDAARAELLSGAD